MITPRSLLEAPMLRLASTLSLALTLAGVSVPGHAAESGDTGRFTLMPYEDGLLRLDSRTGGISLCAIESGSVQCRAGADERAALEAEIERLARDNADLRAKIANAPATEAPPPASPAPTPAPRTEAIPDDPALDKALDFADRFMRRMMRIMRDEQPEKRT
jgi:hypothetical protein